MKVETFTLERWMSTWETVAKFDIAESGIYPLTTRELLDFLPSDERRAAEDQLLDLRLGYTEARGTERLRADLAATYDNVTPDQILVTTGAIAFASSIVWASGTSQYTCLPALIVSSTICRCRCVGVAMSTASTFSSASNCR